MTLWTLCIVKAALHQFLLTWIIVCRWCSIICNETYTVNHCTSFVCPGEQLTICLFHMRVSTNYGCHNIACRNCRLLKVHCISHYVHEWTCCIHVSTDPSQSSAVRHPASMTCSHSVVFTAGMHDNVNITCHGWCSVYMYVVYCINLYITWYMHGILLSLLVQRHHLMQASHPPWDTRHAALVKVSIPLWNCLFCLVHNVYCNTASVYIIGILLLPRFTQAHFTLDHHPSRRAALVKAP